MQSDWVSNCAREPDSALEPNTVRPAPRRPDELQGTVLDGRYFVQCVAATGGHGVVFRACDTVFDLPVALKLLKTPTGLTPRQREGLVGRFVAEGRTLFQLSALHPAVVRAHAMGTVTTRPGPPTPYLVMEWLNGRSFDQELGARQRQGRPFGLQELVLLFDRLVEGLAAAHSHGVAHRDIKPANIMVMHRAPSTPLKLLDFGQAKAMCSRDPASEAMADRILGGSPFTPAYAAPEQWLPQFEGTGSWTDVHALALVLVEALAGRRALAAGESTRLRAACLDESVRPTPRHLGLEVSDQVEAVFARALALRPSHRYRDAGSFWQSLRSAALETPIDAARARSRPHLACPYGAPEALDPLELAETL